MDDGLPPLREVIEQHQLAAKKALGQNFLLDFNLTRRIARAALQPLSQKWEPVLRQKEAHNKPENIHVVEVGPGPGGLTRALLLEGAAHVHVIEKDERCLAALENIRAVYPERLSIYHADALEFDFSRLDFGDALVRIAANLPYNVGTALLIDWIASETWPPRFERFTLMFQREVAMRIVAQPSTEHYGRLSVLAGWRTAARILFSVHPSAFTPPPKVTSAIVELVPRALRADDPSAKALGMVTQAAFGQRRKMIRQSLKGLSVDAETLLARSGLAPDLRAENLSVEDYIRLAQILENG